MLIIKLGGSLIQNSLTEINPKIILLVNKLRDENIHSVLSVGGGKLCRLFQSDLRKNGITDFVTLDTMGIAAINLNSEYVKHLYVQDKRLFPYTINSDDSLNQALESKDKYSFFVSGAWEIGQSSDTVSVNMALKFNSTQIVRMSDVDSVYDSDPKQNPNAKKLKNISWKEYLNILGTKEWESGANFPVDPIAAQLSMGNKISFGFTTLDEFLNLDKVEFSKFTGTVIS